MNPIGAHTWIWVSPLTDEWVNTLAPQIRAWGFDIAGTAGGSAVGGPLSSSVGRTWFLDAAQRRAAIERLGEALRGNKRTAYHRLSSREHSPLPL